LQSKTTAAFVAIQNILRQIPEIDSLARLQQKMLLDHRRFEVDLRNQNGAGNRVDDQQQSDEFNTPNGSERPVFCDKLSDGNHGRNSQSGGTDLI